MVGSVLSCAARRHTEDESSAHTPCSFSHDCGAVPSLFLYQFPNPRHFHSAPVEMDNHDRLRSRGDLLRDPRWIDETRLRVWLDENRRRAVRADRDERGDVRVRGRDYLVPWADAHRLHDEFERIKPIRAPNRVLHATVGRELPLERLAFGAEQIPARIQNTPRRAVGSARKRSLTFLRSRNLMSRITSLSSTFMNSEAPH